MNSFTRADRTRHRIDLKLRLRLPCPEPAGGHPPGLHAGAQHKHFYKYVPETSREPEGLIREQRNATPPAPARTEQ
jgi:hypothetical protein